MNAEFLTDVDGYPSEQTLKLISEWPYTDIAGLIRFISPYFKQHGAVLDGCEEGIDENLVELVTGGWSGCEDIISVMRDNHIMWAVHWFQSRRGGAHKFAL